MEKWVQRWKYMMSANAAKPGVWRLKEGGYYIRGRAKDPRTGKLREVSLPLLDAADAVTAFDTLQDELRKIRQGEGRIVQTLPKFRDYALSLMQRKIQSGEICSAKTRQTWTLILEKHLIPTFGNLTVDELRRAALETWKSEVAQQVRIGKYSPVTVNGWIRVLGVIVRSAVGEFELDRDPMMGFKSLDVSTHETYTDEEPNSLAPAEVPLFLAEMRRNYPQHFAMVALGFSTGLRPSSLRPLRRHGAMADVLWNDGVLLVRRSQTVGDEVMTKTKTGLRQRLSLPMELVDILRWHAEQLPEGPMRDSELLFPSETGGFRAASCLDKPFAAVLSTLDLGKRITPRGMRRTFQDLARAAEVKDIVTRAVSGHATEEMQRHYSTVSGEEMRRNLAKVAGLAGLSVTSPTEVVGKVVGKGQERAADPASGEEISSGHVVGISQRRTADPAPEGLTTE